MMSIFWELSMRLTSNDGTYNKMRKLFDGYFLGTEHEGDNLTSNEGTYQNEETL